MLLLVTRAVPMAAPEPASCIFYGGAMVADFGDHVVMVAGPIDDLLHIL
jgi:hypothetical protein